MPDKEPENRRDNVREDDLGSIDIEALCRDTWKPLYGYVYCKVQNREETEDIVQETYARALSHGRKQDYADASYIAYLKTIALNILRDGWRLSKKRGKNISLDTVNLPDLTCEDPAEAGGRRDMIKSALDGLNREQRQVIMLRIVEGYSTAEAARIMGRKEGNIRVLQYRALKKLSSFLENIKESEKY